MLILASQSPRRVELLKQLGANFIQCSVNIDETPIINENPKSYVLRMAKEKALTGFTRAKDKTAWVLGADTSVVFEGTILGKPENKSAAHNMLKLLANNTHQVYTAVSITGNKQQKTILVETQVQFAPLTNSQIDWYWTTGEPQDKAGSYGIQGLGGQFVKQISGSYSAVVGLPLYETKSLLMEFGVLNEC
ncbi:nucleoside triphosphate pyrophosphatase [Paraglaciecola sp. L3A3]|uniref:Maf family protein n=1 Tax=Paraglaciecola sp. L3A3 TaxID=2686358 RepID=UPI00131D08A5|nr:Maf family protein [Paraglaciecola sp. L3A3]